MTQNNNSRNHGSRSSNREWNEDRSFDQDRRQNNDYDQDQHAAQGVSSRWNRTSGYQGDSFGNDRRNDYNERSGGRYDGNYAGREYGSGNGYSSESNNRNEQNDWNERYERRLPYGERNDRWGQDRNSEDQSSNDRGNYGNSSRSMYGNDYSQGQYGSQLGRNYEQGQQYGRDNYNSNGRGGNYGSSYGNDNSYGNSRSYGLGNSGTNYGMGTNYGSNSNYGSGNWNSGANNRNDESMSGQHRGKGPKGYNRSDDRIKEDISDRLSDDAHVDASEIEVEVNNGVVSLTGTVDHRDTKHRAEDIAESVSGVSNVENRLSVSKGSNSSTGSGSTDRQNSSKPSTTVTHSANDHGSDSKSKRPLTGSHN